MTLVEYELQSSTWLKLKEHIEERIAFLRKKNDGDLTERETAHLRGQVVALKNLLAWAATPGPVTIEPDE